MTDAPTREPIAGHATYPGNHAPRIVGEVMGPNAFREYVTAVTAEHDPATDRTRVGFAYATVDEVAAAGLAAA